MEPNAAISLLELNGRLKFKSVIPGLSVAFFERVHALFATDSRRAVTLAKRWRKVLLVGDDPSLVYRAKGLGEWASGKWELAAQSFVESGRLQLDGSWTFALPAVDALSRAGDLEGALELAGVLRDRLSGNTVASARLLVNVGNAYEQTDDLVMARRCFEEAAAVLRSNEGSVVDLAKALVGQAGCAWQLGLTAESERCSQEAIKIFSGLGLQEFVDVCSANLSQLAMLSGRLDVAVRDLTELRERAQGPRKGWIAELLGFVYRKLNLVPEALDCLEEALAMGGHQKVGEANIHAGIGLCLLDLGQRESAERHLAQAKRIYRKLGNTMMPALIETDMAEVLVASGRYSEAEEKARKAAQTLDRSLAMGSSLLAQALASEAQIRGGLREGSVSALCDRLVRSHDPNLVWRGHYLAALNAGGDRAKFRLMLRTLLQSRLLLASPLSRAAFWGDKRRALRAYLSQLLERGGKSGAKEALSVISRVRSATLIDEILGSSGVFDEDQRKALEELRGQLNILAESEGLPVHVRFATRATRVGRSISRRWHETSQETLSGSSALEFIQAESCAAMVSVGDHYRALLPSGDAIALLGTVDCTERQAATFRFECMEPLVNPSAGARHCLETLFALKQTCFDPWISEEVSEVCPEDGLWSVPWQAFPLMSGVEREIAIRLTPLVAKKLTAIEEPHSGRVAIWIGPNASLPNIRKERDLFLARFPNALVCESRQQVLESMRREGLDLVHVSAHGRHQEGNPMFSYIEFPDGPLYAAEISSLNFRVRKAVLLSCESGRVTIPFRREPDGLARAFLARGAEEVVGSSWLLDDDAALDLFRSLYSDSLSKSFAESLSKARKCLRERYVHPFYWGGPVLIRGYGVSNGSVPSNLMLK